ncbi:MAG TPA: hypothetical protein VGB73_18715 [Pyrinomonadaceae bacterium]
MAAGARFCRRCGQAAAYLRQSSVTEATTRIFDAPTYSSSAAQTGFAAKPTGAAYLAPQQMHEQPLSHINNTMGLEARRSGSWLKWAFVALVIFALAAALALPLVAGWWRERAGAGFHPPIVVVPEPPVPPMPPMPPMPPEVGAPGAASIDPEFFYPGSRVTLDISQDDGGVVGLHTNDAVEKVAAWYTQKLKPERVVRVPGASTVMEAEGMKAVISSAGNGTDIILKREE